METPGPVELTRELTNELRERANAGELPAAYVIRHGQATWVTVSCEGVIANIQPEIVEPDPRAHGGYRVRSNVDDELVEFYVPEAVAPDGAGE